MAIKAVVFDVGETLVDETRQWGEWADWLGLPRLTFFGVLGALIGRGEHHRQVFEYFAPGFDREKADQQRTECGAKFVLQRDDFYPDALPCLAALQAGGFKVGIAGNQPLEVEAQLAMCGTPADFVASSARWGVEKPSPLFFQKVVEAAHCEAHQIAYVGDRLDNDVLPAQAVGMKTIFIRRGPWGFLHAEQALCSRADARIDRLSALPGIFARWNEAD